MPKPQAGPPPVAGNLAQAASQAQGAYDRGDWAGAEHWCRLILKARADHFEALTLLGIIAAQTQRLDEAEVLFARAVTVRPRVAAAHNNHGNVLRAAGRHEQALTCFSNALIINPDFPEAHNNRGNTLHELGRLTEALEAYGRALQLKHDYAEALNNRGTALLALQRPDEALSSFERALLLKPEYAEAWSNRGNALHALKRHAQALQSYDQAIKLKPDYADAFRNRGNSQHELGLLEDALRSYAQALQISPEFAEAHVSAGVVLEDLGQFPAALARYDQAIALAPDLAIAHHNRSMTLLLRGDFAAGWSEYEWRWRNPFSSSFAERRHIARPLWLGEGSLAGKRILLYGEQGLGDSIQFCRYGTLVADLGATVILETPAALRGLLAGLAGVTQLVTRGEVLPEFDWHCPLMSLPLAFGTDANSIPSASRYLASDRAKVARWEAALGRRNKPRIGLVWSGNPRHSNDRNRSLPFRELLRHLGDECQWISLQKDLRDGDVTALRARTDIMHLGSELGDFSDTAALCECLDVVVSVDTSVAHLSAALGRKTWLLLPAIPDWRWLLGREDSPWYPTMRLYRQQRRGDWDGVLRRVVADLRRV